MKSLPPGGAVRCGLACAALMLLALAASPQRAAAQAAQVSLADLARTSTDVVIGEVESKQPRWDASRTRIYTEVRLRVSDRVKGEAPEETVVLVPGGQIGNTLYEVSDMPIFVDGEEVLVFLWQAPSGERLVTGAAHGKLRVFTEEDGTRRLEPGAAELLNRPSQLTAPVRSSLQADDPDRRAEPALRPTGRVSLETFLDAVRAAEGR